MFTIEKVKKAWDRVKEDIKTDRVFVCRPYEIDLVDFDNGEFLETLLQALEAGSFVPSVANICEVPKSKYLIRPGSDLSIEDRIVYATLVNECYEKIFNVLNWSNRKIDYSYLFPEKMDSEKWIIDSFLGWNEFREKSVSHLEKYNYVFIGDISGYYEYISIKTLISELKTIGVNERVLDLLSRCLNTWNNSSDRGIPQGHTPSDILAKFYLNVVDKRLNNSGYIHLRYVDDYRIFTNSHDNAKRAIVDLSRHLRERGLILQSEKSKILVAEYAKEKISGRVQDLLEIAEEFEEEIEQIFFDVNVPYPFWAPPSVEPTVTTSFGEKPKATIKGAFREHFLENQDSFDKSLFHYLIRRLGEMYCDDAVEYCLDLLRRRPEETPYIVQYFKKIGILNGLFENVLEFLESSSCVYVHQKYVIFKWIGMEAVTGTFIHKDKLLPVLRKYSFDLSVQPFLRCACRKVLGDYAEIEDLIEILNSYEKIKDPYERGEIICDIRHMDKIRRNAFYSRVEASHPWVTRAVKLAKSQRLPNKIVEIIGDDIPF